MFCLQCGRAVEAPKSGASVPAIDETADPILRRAITDSLGHELKWRLPISAAPPREIKSFAALHRAMAVPKTLTPLATGGSITSAIARDPVMKKQAYRSRSERELSAEKRTVVNPINLVRPNALLQWLKIARLGWSIGFAVAVGFILINLALYGYYSNRVYPGVRVGSLSVGGMNEAGLSRVLNEKDATIDSINVMVGGSRYTLANKTLATPDIGRAVREAMGVGHSVDLPVAGMIAALLSKPVVVQQNVNEHAIELVVQNLAHEVDHVAADAEPMIVGGQAFVIPSKNGEAVSVSQAEANMHDAEVAGIAEVSIPISTEVAELTASSFQDDLMAAQARLGLTYKLIVGSSSYVASSEQIGAWIAFAGPGKGVLVNQGAIAAYVSGIPGRFDRAGAFSALVSAVTTAQNLAYIASTAKISATPPVSTTRAPQVSYRYCIGDTVQADQLSSKLIAVFADPLGWGIGGRIQFVRADSECNFTIGLVTGESMVRVDQRCAQQPTCRVGNQVELNIADWNTPPIAWKSGTVSYQAEMINHEVGHWLGFDHASCMSTTNQTFELQSPTIVLGGCSPNWYLITSDQSNKVLQGFN